MAYAVIQTGGKQYRVAEGDVIEVEKLAFEPGADAKFEEVLLVSNGNSVSIGAPPSWAWMTLDEKTSAVSWRLVRANLLNSQPST